MVRLRDDLTWGAAAYVSAREEAAPHHGRLCFLSRAPLAEPGHEPDPHPDRREHDIEDEEPEREQHHPEGPVVERHLRLGPHAGASACRRRCSTSLMMRLAVSSIARLET